MECQYLKYINMVKFLQRSSFMDFPHILKDLRKENELTQKELAKACNLSPQCISSLEKGINSPTATTLNAIAEYFGVTVDYLIGREGFTDKEIERGVGNHPTYLSSDEWEWLELRSEIIEKYGEKYLPALSALIKSFTENLPK